VIPNILPSCDAVGFCISSMFFILPICVLKIGTIFSGAYSKSACQSLLRCINSSNIPGGSLATATSKFIDDLNKEKL